MNDKPEWERQLNLYAALVRRTKGVQIDHLNICAILRDWKRAEADRTRDYPEAPIVLVDIPVWSVEEQEAYLLDRVKIHQDAHRADEWGEELPHCTSEERWERGEVWAVMKKGRKTAVRVLDNESEAIKMAEDGVDLSVVHRPGRLVRCEGNYCGVAKWCSQYQLDVSA